MGRECLVQSSDWRVDDRVVIEEEDIEVEAGGRDGGGFIVVVAG